MLKQFIYRKRCFKQVPNFAEFKQEIKRHKNIEHYIATKNNHLRKHYKKWNTKT